MAERKSVNRWIPPNFDPSAIPLRTRIELHIPNATITKERRPQRTVRLMMPFTCKCTACGEYIHKGRKFNARKETCWGETYLGVQIFRFYVRCTLCAAEITFRTDPQNADYLLEQGATRNAEPWRKETTETEALKIKRKMEEENDPMKALENRTLDSKKEIERAEALDELRSIKEQLEHVDKDLLLLRAEQDAREARSLPSGLSLPQEDEEVLAIEARLAFEESRAKRNKATRPVMLEAQMDEQKEEAQSTAEQSIMHGTSTQRAAMNAKERLASLRANLGGKRA